MRESQIQSAILEYLAAKHVLAFRMNTGAVLASHNGKTRMVRYGVPGMADVLAFPTVYRSDGIHVTAIPCVLPLWIECKAAKGKQSELQKSFQQQVELHGHRYIVAHSIEDVERTLGS